MIPDKMNAEVDKSTQGVLLDLFELDLTQFGGGIFYFCNQQNEKGGNVFWRGFEYQAYPKDITTLLVLLVAEVENTSAKLGQVQLKQV